MAQLVVCGMVREGRVDDDSSEDLWTPRPVTLPVLAVKQPVLLARVRISAESKPAEQHHRQPASAIQYDKIKISKCTEKRRFLVSLI